MRYTPLPVIQLDTPPRSTRSTRPSNDVIDLDFIDDTPQPPRRKRRRSNSIADYLLPQESPVPPPGEASRFRARVDAPEPKPAAASSSRLRRRRRKVVTESSQSPPPPAIRLDFDSSSSASRSPSPIRRGKRQQRSEAEKPATPQPPSHLAPVVCRLTIADQVAALKARRAAREHSAPRRVARSVPPPRKTNDASKAPAPVSVATASVDRAPVAVDTVSLKAAIRSDHMLVERLCELVDGQQRDALCALRKMYPRCVFCRMHFRGTDARCRQPHVVTEWEVDESGRTATGNCKRCNVRMQAEVGADGRPRRNAFGTCHDGLHTADAKVLTSLRVKHASDIVCDERM